MKVIVENKIPFIRGRVEQIAGIDTVEYLSPEGFTPAKIADADILVIRTRTRCDAALLQGSRVSHIITATIGTDHIDLEWCKAHGIRVDNAPGCNALAVAQWVRAAITAVKGTELSNLTIGVIGVGHVGSIVAQQARDLGMSVLLNDPPRALAENSDRFVHLDSIAANADIITFHPSLNPTSIHLCDSAFLAKCQRKPMILNAARGPIIDTAALIQARLAGQVSALAIDCWEGEPDINLELLRLADIATPHIAGYSLEGKQRATQMALNALSGCNESCISNHASHIGCSALQNYDIMADTRAFKAAPEAMESLRNNYPLRHED